MTGLNALLWTIAIVVALIFAGIALLIIWALRQIKKRPDDFYDRVENALSKRGYDNRK